jgi:hypothetical protein
MAHDLIFGKNSRNWSRDVSICGDADDPLVWTPGAVKAEMMRVLAIVDAVNQDASQAIKTGKLTPAEWQQWRQTYLTSHTFLTKASSLWGSNVKVARSHESDALKWRDLISSRGYTPQGPPNLGRPRKQTKNANLFPVPGSEEPALQTQEDTKPPSAPLLTTTNVALAVGGVAAISLLVSALKKPGSAPQK